MIELNNNHWIYEGYIQRMSTKNWDNLLLNHSDTIIFKGSLRKLKARSLSASVVEIYKTSIK